jgi:hypothetical protein
VPKIKKSILEDLNLSFGSYSDANDANNRSYSVSECADQFETASTGDNESLSSSSRRSMEGSLTMPLFMYDCSLSTLRNHLIYKGTQEVGDRCLDFRIFTEKSCNNKATLSTLADIDTASMSSSSTEFTIPTSSRKLDDNDLGWFFCYY